MSATAPPADSNKPSGPDISPTAAAVSSEGSLDIHSSTGKVAATVDEPSLPLVVDLNQNVQREDNVVRLPLRQAADGAESVDDTGSATVTDANPPSDVATPCSTTPNGASASLDLPRFPATESSTKWEPNPQLLEAVMSIGFNKDIATKALFYTGNNSADLAAMWLFENPDAHLKTLDLDELSDEEIDLSVPKHKMVFIVNADLKMGLGKIAAQVAHATLGLYRKMLDTKLYNDVLVEWDMTGETKVVLKGDNSDHLHEVAKSSTDIGVPNYLVFDAGRTQIAAGSCTVLSIFGPNDVVDSLTGKLKLL